MALVEIYCTYTSNVDLSFMCADSSEANMAAALEYLLIRGPGVRTEPLMLLVSSRER